MKTLPVFLAVLLSFFLWCTPVHAKGKVLGIHILAPGEIDRANQLLEHGDDKDKFVTIPLTIADLSKPKDWQRFFDECHRLKIRPILRLTTRFENGTWTVPNRVDVMAYANFLTSLEWHRPDMTIIMFNEPNHANEWGGEINPESFADISEFTARWFHTETKSYTVLPAAMDLAADGRNGTMEAFAYWRRALARQPTLIDTIDGWNSHSYPNPAFSASPTKIGQNSLRGYETELSFIRNYTIRDLPVYITETGWNQNVLSDARLKVYYQQAYSQIWDKDARIVAVTPFLLQGAPGTFAPFSFLDANGKPTKAYDAYKQILDTRD